MFYSYFNVEPTDVFPDSFNRSLSHAKDLCSAVLFYKADETDNPEYIGPLLCSLESLLSSIIEILEAKGKSIDYLEIGQLEVAGSVEYFAERALLADVTTFNAKQFMNIYVKTLPPCTLLKIVHQTLFYFISLF